MNWLVFAILGVMLLTVQTVVAPVFRLCGLTPDWLLVSVVFFSLYANRKDALIACFLLGIFGDLLSLERFGLLAVSFLLVGGAVTAVREYLFRERALTRFVVTFATSVMIGFLWLVYRGMIYADGREGWSDWLGAMFFASLYTAAWAPPGHMMLRAFSRPLGIARPRYSFAGLRAERASHV